MGALSSCCSSEGTDKHESHEAPPMDLPGTNADVTLNSAFGKDGKTSPTAASRGSLVEFTIKLNKTERDTLGVDVDHKDERTLLIEKITGGLIGDWNSKNPGKQVKVGDRIVAVNGKRDDVFALVGECRRQGELTMMLRRG
mmetsp:Transcript_120484/g.236813  ORF Transcript_120484/g.236813 Transcript_120484/m.236813 type:complete len:141 (+) Transcript_120484:76-498(+)